MDDTEGGHAEEVGRTSSPDKVAHAQEDMEADDMSHGCEAGVPDNADADDEPEDDGGEDVEADEHGDGGDDTLKAAITEQMEAVVAAANELFGEETV
jgi:hypothetical protein